MNSVRTKLKPNPSVLSPAPVRVLVIDDHAAMRAGLAQLIGGDPLVPRSVFTTGSSAVALRHLNEARPQLVVLDVDLAGVDGLVLLPQLAALAHVVVLTNQDDAATRHRALRLGADAFVVKGAPASALLAHLARLATLDSRGERAPPKGGPSSNARAVSSSADDSGSGS